MNALNSELTVIPRVKLIYPNSTTSWFSKKAVGHYQAYNFRPDGQICLYDNQSNNCKALDNMVRPELLFFVKEWIHTFILNCCEHGVEIVPEKAGAVY